MSIDLDDYYTPRVKQKHKARHTYPNRQDDVIRPPPLRQRNMSFPVTEDESSEKCVIKEYSHNRLKKEIVITKRKKVHPTTDEEPEPEPELDSELIMRCLAAVSRKILKLLCYLSLL